MTLQQPLFEQGTKDELELNLDTLEETTYDGLPLEFLVAESSKPALPRFGYIHQILTNQSVSIVLEGDNPTKATEASLGRLFTSDEIQMAIDNQLACRIEFHNERIPSVTDIFFSILETDKSLKIRAKSIQIEAENTIELMTGDTKIELSAKQIKQSASHISSKAEKNNSIEGGSISLN